MRVWYLPKFSYDSDSIFSNFLTRLWSSSNTEHLAIRFNPFFRICFRTLLLSRCWLFLELWTIVDVLSLLFNNLYPWFVFYSKSKSNSYSYCSMSKPKAECWILWKCSIFSIDSLRWLTRSIKTESLAFNGIFLLTYVSLCMKQLYGLLFGFDNCSL